MHTTNLRKVGGSVMMAAPPAVLETLHLSAGVKVSSSVDDRRLVVEPKTKTKYTMGELLAASDYSGPHTQEDREWVDAPAVGGEIL